MTRLHDGGDAERGEPRQVVGVQALRVHDAVPRTGRTVGSAGLFEPVQGDSDPTVSGAVHVTGPPAALDLDHDVGELLRSPERRAALPGPVRVGLQHRSRPWLDDVVDVELDRADPQAIVVEARAHRLELVAFGIGGAHRVEHGRHEP